MPDAWIHIGAPKCASSLIQGMLNEPEISELVKPEYQPQACKVIQSHTPCKDFEDYYYRQILDGIREMIPKKDCLFSLENLFGMMTHSENCYESSKQVIEYLWKDFDIHIFMYVRRQDTLLESWYSQDVKRGELRSFDEYILESEWNNFHWDAIAENYSSFDLTVRPFESSVLKTGGYEDFTDALFKWLGADVTIDNLPVVNPSLSPGGLEVQILANEKLTKKQSYDLSLWLERHAAKDPDTPHDLWGDSTEFLKRFEDSNKRLFTTYMPEFNGDYYLGC